MSSTNDLPPLPASLGGNPTGLVLAVNDRLRRITQALNNAGTGTAGTPGAAGKPGPPGSSGAGEIFYGTHANRLATAVPLDASLYIETDRGNVVYQVQSTAWAFLSGTFSRTQAQLAALEATLGAGDEGFLADVTDYAHMLRWTGTTWAYADPSDPPGRIEGFLVDPPAPGWHLCDGSAAVPYLKGDGSVGNENLPNLFADPAFLVLGPTASGINPAVAPLITGNTASAVTGITTGALTGNDSGASTQAAPFVTGVAVSVPAEPHVHASAAVIDTGHVHAVGTLVNGITGVPQNIVLRAWFRQ